jgi:hypothetical protein
MNPAKNSDRRNAQNQYGEVLSSAPSDGKSTLKTHSWPRQRIDGLPTKRTFARRFFIASSARRALVDLVMGTLARRICVYVHFRLLRFEEAQSPRESRVRATPDKRFYADRLIEGLRRIIPG